jgi:HAD superfamily hydrolase (TIGR01549 family)
VTDTAIFDVDGTLVDTNYHHAVAWFRAFRKYDVTPPVWRIHRAIGMGGDKLVSYVAGNETEERCGDGIRDAWTAEYERFLPDIQPFSGARELLVLVRARGLRLVLASSGQRDHVEHYLDLLAARDLTEAWTTSEDAEESKPAPDLVETALAKVGGGAAIMIGDSTWDCEAAGRAGMPVFALLSGGFSADELREAGARRVYSSLEQLHDDFDLILEVR